MKVNKFKNWWIVTLLSCLPEKLSGYLSNTGRNFNLIITRQKNTVFLLNQQGSIIDSVPLTDSVEIEVTDLPQDASDVGYLSNNDLSLAENLASKGDPPISLNAVPLDFITVSKRQDVSEQTLDFIVGEENRDQKYPKFDSDSSDTVQITNVISLNRSNVNDDTILLADEDQTTRLLDTSFQFEDDTVIVQNDQGNLLQFDSTSPNKRDATVLFHSDGGRIRQVDSDKMEDNLVDHSNVNNDLSSEVDDLINNAEEYGIVANLLEKYQGSKKCLYLLPEDKLLILNLTYPIEALQNIENVLRYDLEKHIPLSFQEIRYFYALNINGQSKKVDVEVAVIKSEEYDLLNISLRPFIEKGLFCTTEKFFEKYGNKISFLEPDAETSWISFFKLSNIHLAMNWTLLLIALVMPLYLLFQEVQGQDKNTPEEISRVKDIVNSVSTIDTELKFRSKLFEKINQAPRSVELLTKLSNNINSLAWITKFTLKNNEIKIKGEADSATSVSDDLSSTGLFQSIKFVSSIVKNAKSGKETFELLLVLNTDA